MAGEHVNPVGAPGQVHGAGLAPHLEGPGLAAAEVRIESTQATEPLWIIQADARGSLTPSALAGLWDSSHNYPDLVSCAFRFRQGQPAQDRAALDRLGRNPVAAGAGAPVPAAAGPSGARFG
jgi:hypothetical protein